MKSERMWDRMAANWDKPGAGLSENDTRIIEKARKYLNLGSIVVDYGCATGSITLELAKTVKEVHGVDFSEKMIAIATRKAGESKAKNAFFTHGTIFNEKFKNESIDVLLALKILPLLEDLPQVLNRINSLLKPGGVFISLSHCLGENKLISLPVNAGVFLLSKTGILPNVNSFSVSKLTDAIILAGFQATEVTTISGSMLRKVLITAKKDTRNPSAA